MRKLNDVVWIIILFALAYIMGSLLYTQKIILFLSPRMTLVAFFGFCVLLCLFCINLWNLFSKAKKQKSSFRLGYLMFLIPIILYITTTPDSDTINQLPNRSVNISSGIVAADDSDSSTSHTNSEMPNVFSSNAQKFAPCVILDAQDEETSKDQFVACLSFELETIWGKDVTMEGFVLKDESFPDDVIMVARYIVSCCMADAYPAGFPVKVENTKNFKDGQWISVTGTFDGIQMESYGTYSDYPIITNGTIVFKDPPPVAEQYVYP